MEYDGQAWVSLGFSPNGDMVGSDAVIGLPDAAEVVEYELASKVMGDTNSTKYPISIFFSKRPRIRPRSSKTTFPRFSSSTREETHHKPRSDRWRKMLHEQHWSG